MDNKTKAQKLTKSAAELMDQGDIKGALKLFNQVIKLLPQSEHAFFNRGHAYSQLEDHRKAISEYGKAIKLNPKAFDAYYRRGLSYKALEKYNMAIRDFDRVIELKPKHAAAAASYVGRGSSYFDLGKYELAVMSIKKAIGLDPDCDYLWFIQGRALVEANKKEEAVLCFKKALELNPDSDPARECLVPLLKELGKPGKIKKTDWKIVKKGRKYCLRVRNQVLNTPAGYLLESKSPELMKNIVRELYACKDVVVDNGVIIEEPGKLSSYSLASVKKKVIDEGSFDVPELIRDMIMEDSIFEATAPDPFIMMYQVEQQKPAIEFLEKHGLELKTRDNYYSKKEERILIAALQDEVGRLSPFQVASLINLHFIHGQFIMSLMYLTGRCSKTVWAKAVFSRTRDVKRILGLLPEGFVSLPDNLSEKQRDKIINSILAVYKKECSIVDSYLKATKCDL